MFLYMYEMPYRNIPQKVYKDKYISIYDQDVLPCKSSQELNKYKSVIGNYAKSNKVTIKFFDPRKFSDVMQPLLPGVELGGCVGIKVTPDKYNSESKYALVNLFESENDRTPFIKKLYNKLAEVIENKPNPFEAQKRATVEKLIKCGKVLA